MSGSNEWTSLETADFILGLCNFLATAATPILVTCLGVHIHRLTKNFEHTQWQNQKLIEKRLVIYDDIAPDLNDLLCYAIRVGGWKENVPSKIIEIKRALDKKINLAKPLFSKQFSNSYEAFEKLYFDMHTGTAQDAKIKLKHQKYTRLNNWLPEYKKHFSKVNKSNPDKIQEAYDALMNCFSEEIGINRLL